MRSLRARRPRAWLGLAAAVFGLAGCYGSERQLFDLSQAARPLALGDGTAGNGRGQASADNQPVRVQALPGGAYLVSPRGGGDADKPATLVFVPLGDRAGSPDYAMSMQVEGQDGVIYGVARPHAGRLAFTFPFCVDEGRSLALASGAVEEGAANQRVCRFSSRAGLMSALRVFAAAAPVGPDDIELPAARPARP